LFERQEIGSAAMAPESSSTPHKPLPEAVLVGDEKHPSATMFAFGRLGFLRGAIGAVAGILVAGLLARWSLGIQPKGMPWLVAPVGASAVLVFAVPASPLAQPWSVIGGNILSLMVGLTTAQLMPMPWLAAPVAVGAAIALMSLARCLHPPGGACALVGALAPPALAASGGAGLLVPLALNIAALVTLGFVFNNLTGHRWPHRAPPPGAHAQSVRIIRYEPEDLDAVLENWDEVLDIERSELDALFRAVERQAEARYLGESMPR